MASSKPVATRIVTDALERSLSAGRITASEADVIARFFACSPASDWPRAGLQQRMQESGGRDLKIESPELPR